MFSRIAHQIAEKQDEKSNTLNMKEQLAFLKNEKYLKQKSSENSHHTDSGKWHKNSTPNVEGNRRNELDAICEEYGTKVDASDVVKEKMVKLKDVQKEYKSSQNDFKTQFNRYTSNKNSKGEKRRVKQPDSKCKENENTLNDISQKKVDHKNRTKKTKSRRHKKAKHDISF